MHRLAVGTWIHPAAAHRPDGSNFQLQHWTHTFEYAVVADDGDWRQAAIPAHSAGSPRPPRVVTESSSAAGGLPAAGSLLEIEPAGTVQLGALKAAGNPLARRQRPTCASIADGVAVRLVETSGAAADVEVRSGLRRVSASARVDLLEQPRVQNLSSEGLTLHGFEIATVLTRLNLPQVLDADHTELAPDAEAAQPLYARYWLHNRGPAPLGGLPAVAHLHPQHVDAEPNSQVRLRLTAASDCSDTVLHGRVRLLCPQGWAVDPAELPFMLPPGEHLETDVLLTAPSAASPGLYPVRAELALTGHHVSMPPAWRQVVEDVCVVSVDAPPTDTCCGRSVGPEPVDVKAGGGRRLTVGVATDAHADHRRRSPPGSARGGHGGGWGLPHLVPNFRARGTAEFSFDVTPPVWVDPGEWWVLIREPLAGPCTRRRGGGASVR